MSLLTILACILAVVLIVAFSGPIITILILTVMCVGGLAAYVIMTAVSFVIDASICIGQGARWVFRSEEHTSELQSLMRISYAVFCLKKKKPSWKQHTHTTTHYYPQTN